MTLFSRARQLPHRSRRDENGYILLTLLLVISLMAIAAIAIVPAMSYQIHRDQEQEMIHRGVQYSRAIRGYYKKFGRYPTRLEDLDNTNNLRYLRKHYKDPVTGKDFKLLHYGEQGVTLAGGVAGGLLTGANPSGGPGNLNGSSSAFGGGSNASSFGNSGFGNSPSGNSGFSNSGFGNSGVNSNGVFSQSSSSFGGNSNSGFGANNSQSNSQNNAGQQGTNPGSGSDSSSATQQVSSGGPGTEPTSSSQQLVASGPIVGVASISKNTGFHEFNHKKKYNEWQFIYDPGTDRGGLITTPNQPTLGGFGNQMGQGLGTPVGSPAGSPFGQQGQSPFGQSGQSSFGQSGQSGFGQSGGFNNNPTPTPPPSNPPQQQ